jgi:hypothetical protein
MGEVLEDGEGAEDVEETNVRVFFFVARWLGQKPRVWKLTHPNF